MHKTLLLCFIHGFKGDDNTFAGFPEHLRALISHALPKITVKAITYPQFETRGDLKECVNRFRDWLQNAVIDIEVAADTPSPTVDPSVRVILIGHSMGGIVAADTLIGITSETPIPYSATSTPFPSSTTNASSTSTSVPANNDPPLSPPHSFIFPYIQGVLAFDTPYLGICPSVLAHGAESHYQTATSAYSALTSAASAFGYGASTPSSPPSKQPVGSLPAGPASAKDALAASASAAAQSPWQKWGKFAMFAGAASAVAAGGAAAYMKRDTITSGWTWATSHLEFVGCLIRGEDLKTRMTSLVAAHKDRGIGFADMYTVLGAGAKTKSGTTIAGGFVEIGGGKEPKERTFCNLPAREEWKCYWEGAANEKVADEIGAHMSMFLPRDNPGYYKLCEKAKERVVGWVEEGWYEASERSEAEGLVVEEAGEEEKQDETIIEETA